MKKTFKGDSFNEVLSQLILFQPDTEKYYTLEISEKKAKRSLDANAYCWVLIGKLAEVLRIPADEVYREAIRKAGGYTVIPIISPAVSRFTEIWESHGLGWVVDIIGESKLDGFMNLRCYHGSSSYSSFEMSRLIDEIVFECKENGIETATGAELARLKAEWK